MLSGQHVILGTPKINVMIDGFGISGGLRQDVMGWEQLQVDSIWLVESGEVVVVWVAVTLYQDGPDLEGW